MTDDEHPLGPLSRAVVPDLDAAASDRIEAAMRVQHAARQPMPRRLGGWRLAVPALAVVLLAVAVLLAIDDDPAVAALEIRDAQDVTVVLPTGESIENPADGYGLVDGSQVFVGQAGTVTIDDVMLGPGAVVTVRGDQLVSDVVATTTQPVDDLDERPTTSTTRPPPAVAPTDPPRTTTPDAGPSTTTPVDSRPPTSAPVDTRPVPTEPPTTRPPVTEPPSSTVARPVDGDPLAVGLRVAATDGAARVAWAVEGSLDPSWRVVVVRTIDGSIPEGPGNAVVVGEGPSGDLTETRADLGDDVTVVRYRVVVLDGSGGVVARSEVQSLGR